jgi:Uma2 family endonuclease
MTVEEMDALPEDGKERELIRGELRERGMTRRNRWHCCIESCLAQVLKNWLDVLPTPRGKIVSGEAGFRLRRDPDTAVGIDVAYVSAEVVAQHPDSPYFEGPPVLAVEILSPSDKQEEIDEKIELYLECGVRVVWIVNPRLKTLTAYRPDAAPALYHGVQVLDAEPHMPGFRLTLSELF